MQNNEQRIRIQKLKPIQQQNYHHVFMWTMQVNEINNALQIGSKLMEKKFFKNRDSYFKVFSKDLPALASLACTTATAALLWKVTSVNNM